MLVSYQRPVQSYPSVFDWVFSQDVHNSMPRQPILEAYEDGFAVSVDVPGVGPNDLTLRVEDRRLNLIAKRPGVDDAKAQRFAWKLPRSADSDQIEATLSHGVLTVTVSKSEGSQPREISVKSVQE